MRTGSLSRLMLIASAFLSQARRALRPTLPDAVVMPGLRDRSKASPLPHGKSGAAQIKRTAMKRRNRRGRHG